MASLIGKEKGNTTDRHDPRLGHGSDDTPREQSDVYLVLSEEERAKGFVRPVRRSYVHRFMLDGSELPVVIISAKEMGGCGALTTMGLALAETYAADPNFYGATYCTGCMMHRPVSEFYWDKTNERVGS